jgi:tetratricopeptide (TPR) repeat protein
LQEAQAILETGLQLEPGRSSLHKNLGRVYLQQNDVDKAVEELRQAVDQSRPALDGIYFEALYYLAVAYQGQGDEAAACASLQEYRPAAQGDMLERTQAAQALWQELECS